MATDNPTEYLLGDEKVPAIQGLMPIDEENPTPRVFKFQGMIKVTFWEIFKALIEMYPEKLKEYEESTMAKKFKEQNPTADPEERKSVPRKFTELKSQADYKNVCVSHKACAIALLPAIQTIDYEKESFEQKVALLEKMDEAAGKKMSPIHYTWINATCHVSAKAIV
jgi:hypothetical protein